MSDRIEALVNPKMLVWARQTAGFNVNGAAKRMKVKPQKIEDWENGGSKPTVLQAIKLSEIYRRPLSAFYLDSPPKDSSIVMTDFRRVLGSLVPASPALLLERRHAEERRAIMLDLTNEGEGVFQELNSSSINDDPEHTAQQVRETLGVDWETQRSWSEPRDGLNAWRAAIEARNVLVFQTDTQGLPIDVSEARGFSMSMRRFPVIVINGADSPRGRIFTLLHEFTHLLVNVGGICDLREVEGMASQDQRIEVFCNHVAGAVLMPAPLIYEHQVVVSHEFETEWSDSEIESLARDFMVSNEALVRRLLILRLTSRAFYERKRADFEQAWLEHKRRQKEEGRKPVIKRHRLMIARNGKPYTRSVLGAYYDGQISMLDVARFLDLKLKHIKDTEVELFKSPGV